MTNPVLFEVGVFAEQRKRSIQLRAYTMWFNADWKGCCVHHVSATSGKEAKKIAMANHRANCMKAVNEREAGRSS